MSSGAASGRVASFMAASKVAGAALVAMSALVLVGWTFDVLWLKCLTPGLVAMNPASACCFAAAGVSLAISSDDRASPRRRQIARGLALAVILAGALVLGRYLFGWDVQLDERLFAASLDTTGAGRPNRMAPNTSVGFALLGAALLAIDVEPRRGPRPSNLFALPALLSALLALLGYAYGVYSFYGVGGFVPMALHTALAFLVLAGGILFARPHRGVMEVVASDSAGGVMARRLLPAAALIPPILGGLRLIGERVGLFGAEVGLLLVVVANVSALVGLVWWNARLLRDADDERRRAEEAVTTQNHLLNQAILSEREAHAALKRAQSTLVQTEKLAGLGQMVAGVAHEINNPLAFVTNNVAVLQRDVGAACAVLKMYAEADGALADARPDLVARIHDARERADLDYFEANADDIFARTRDGLKRIQQIVKDLRDFARLDESDLHDANLNEGIASTVNIVKARGRRKRVAIEVELAPLPLVACHPAKINQVVMNLVANAIDASAEGGTVIVRSAMEEGGVRVEVVDRGAGIDPAVIDRVFDPFFTTKPPGEGTGLGLSICHGIVRDHGGTIAVESKPGDGARFIVHLPLRRPEGGALYFGGTSGAPVLPKP